MLFSRYAGASEYVLNYEFETGFDIIRKAYEKRLEEDMQRRWLIGGYEKEMSFSEFRQKLIGAVAPAQKEKTEKEIFEKVRKILEMTRRE